jgi:DNA-binding MarR family transcriptional regulator
MLDLLQSQKPWWSEQLAAFDVTVILNHALHMLAEAGEPTMSTFASLLFVDASNATGIVDRLVARGLAERRPSERDRRVKVVRLTPAGRRLERRINEMVLSEPPPPFAALSATDQRRLREILERALAVATDVDESESA